MAYDSLELYHKGRLRPLNPLEDKISRLSFPHETMRFSLIVRILVVTVALPTGKSQRCHIHHTHRHIDGRNYSPCLPYHDDLADSSLFSSFTAMQAAFKRPIVMQYTLCHEIGLGQIMAAAPNNDSNVETNKQVDNRLPVNQSWIQRCMTLESTCKNLVATRTEVVQLSNSIRNPVRTRMQRRHRPCIILRVEKFWVGFMSNQQLVSHRRRCSIVVGVGLMRACRSKFSLSRCQQADETKKKLGHWCWNKSFQLPHFPR